MAESPRIQFRARPPLDRLLAERANQRLTVAGRTVEEVARRDLLRYYSLIANELRGLELSEAEACLVCDALNGVWLADELSVMRIHAEIFDGIRLNHLDEKWQVDAGSFTVRVMNWTPAQRVAVADAVERWWSFAPGDDRPNSETLAEVGLIR